MIGSRHAEIVHRVSSALGMGIITSWCRGKSICLLLLSRKHKSQGGWNYPYPHRQRAFPLRGVRGCDRISFVADLGASSWRRSAEETSQCWRGAHYCIRPLPLVLRKFFIDGIITFCSVSNKRRSGVCASCRSGLRGVSLSG